MERFAIIAAVIAVAMVGCGKEGSSTNPVKKLSVPVLSSPSNGAVNQDTSLSLAWDSVSGATSYEAQVATSGAFTGTIFSQAGIISASLSVTGLDRDIVYYWRVNAMNPSSLSPWSDPWSFTTVIAAPGVATLSSPTNGATGQSTSPTMSWGTVTSAVSYGVQLSTASTFATTVSSQSGLTGTSASVSSLANSTAYYWQVNAMNAGGTSVWSSVWSFTTVIAPPGAPMLTAPTNGATGQSTSPTMSWGAVTNASSYGFRLSTASSFATMVSSQSGLSISSAAVSGLANSTAYYWQVNATDAGGTSVWSSVWSFTTVIALPGAPMLTAPTNGATGQSTSPTMSWGAVTNASSYGFRLSTASSFATMVSSQSGLSISSAAVSGLGGNTTYYWQTNATNAGGAGAWSSVWSFTTIAAPGAPALASPTNGATGQAFAPVLSWTTVTGAASYGCQVSTVSTFATMLLSQAGLTAASSSASGLTDNTTYYWRANATNAGGISTWSSVWSFTTLAAPDAPALASPTNGATGQTFAPVLSWTTVTGASSYSCQVSTVSTFATMFLSQTGLTAASSSASGLTDNTTYYWRANATNAAGISAWSAVWSFTTLAAPDAPALASPTNGATGQPLAPILSWTTVSGAASYDCQVSTVSTFTTMFLSQAGLTAASSSASGLTNNTTYYWRANATNAAGISAWSAVWSFTTIAPTAVPMLSSPVNGATNQPTSLTMSWGQATGALSYALQVSTVSTFATMVSNQGNLTATSVAISGLINSTTYYWQANATNVGGASAWSGLWSFTTVIAAPGAATLLSPTNGATGQSTSPTMSWGTVTSAASYGLQLSTVSTFATTVSSQSGLTGTSASVSSLANSTAYYWQVNATNAGGASVWSSVWSFTTVIAPPGAPMLTAPTNGATGQSASPTMSWGAVMNAASYGFRLSTASSFTTMVSSQSGLSISLAAVSGLANSTAYYWQVNATNAGGTSAWSSVWSFTTILAIPDVPALSSPTNGATNQPNVVSLNWGSAARASTYGVQVSTDANFGSTIFGQTGLTAISVALSSIVNSRTYYWHVNAVNAGGASSWSYVWSFTTFFIPNDSILLNPTGFAPLCAIVKFTSAVACRTEIIVHGKTRGNSDLSHQFNDSGLYHADTLAGLYPNYANTVDVLCTVANDSVAASATVTITTGALPANMPTTMKTTVLPSGGVEPGVNLVSNWCRPLTSSGVPQIPYIVDDYGDIRWLLNYSTNTTLKNLSYHCGLARLRDGNYFFGDTNTEKIYEVNMLGTVMNQWSIPAGYTFHHNVIEKPDGNFIATANKTGSTHLNGVATSEDYVIEISRATGALVNVWDLKVSLDEYRTTLTTSSNDWVHGNGVIYDSTDNTIIVSGRVQGVVKLTYGNQVKWILAPHRGWGTNRNGVNLNTLLLTPLDSNGNTITDTGVVNGWTNRPDFEWNWFQHCPAFMPNGDLLLFDNGSTRNYVSTVNPYSRAVEYRIDPVAMTVRQIWSYGKERGNATFSTLFSSVQYLPQTNHMLFCPGYDVANAVAGGNGGKIIEVDYATKGVTLEMEISVPSGISHHRAGRISLYP